jgi:hypothetical protein
MSGSPYLKKCSTFILRGYALQEESMIWIFLLDCMTLENKSTTILQSGTTHPAIQCHIPEGWINLNLYYFFMKMLGFFFSPPPPPPKQCEGCEDAAWGRY